METELRDTFIEKWQRYFGGAELPICLFYSGEKSWAEHLHPVGGQVCVMAQIAQVRRGKTVSFDRDSIGCAGGRRYLGFSNELRPQFEEFLSCGIPGQLEGERYKKTPQIVREAMANIEPFEAPARYAVFKRWDTLAPSDRPEVVVFFATPDVLSGLYTLAGFDETEPQSVIAPFGAGCSTIVQYPSLQRRKPHPKAVLGMFDVSARPFVPAETLSFAVPIEKFERMAGNMDESFLITESWAKVHRRIERA